MGGICEGSKNQKNSGPKESEPPKMEDDYEEGIIKGAKEMKLLEETDQKEKEKCICKINGSKIGTGFFCKIKYENASIPVLITNYHVIDDKYLESINRLKIYINEESKFLSINKSRIIYSSSNNEYDIIIIRLQDGEIENYLEIDENIFENSENSFRNEPIYILHYPGKDEKAQVSFSDKGIEKLDEYDIKHLCNTESGSSGGPILSLMTNKIIGIHKGAIKKGYNIGTFLKFPLNELNQVKQENKENKENEEFSKKKEKIENEIKIFNGIKIEVKVGERDINEDKFIDCK